MRCHCTQVCTGWWTKLIMVGLLIALISLNLSKDNNELQLLSIHEFGLSPKNSESLVENSEKTLKNVPNISEHSSENHQNISWNSEKILEISEEISDEYPYSANILEEKDDIEAPPEGGGFLDSARKHINASSTLHMYLFEDLAFMYSPFFQTLVHGAFSHRINAKVTFLDRNTIHVLRKLFLLGDKGMENHLNNNLTNAIDDPRSPANVLAKVLPGDVFVWVGFKSHHLPYALLRNRGIYTVHYQLEPMAFNPEICKSSSIRSADEIWDYSPTNIPLIYKQCPPKSGAPIRLVPAGFQYHTYRTSQKQIHETSKVYFLGALRFGSRRDCWSSLRSSSPSPRIREMLETKYDIWEVNDFQTLLRSNDTSGIFLNLHKGCAHPKLQAIEPRIAHLLSANGLVISQTCVDIEEDAYRGLVTFLPLDQMGHYIEGLLKLSVSDRQALANRRFRTFQKRFHPAKIFQYSGLSDLFRVPIDREINYTDPPPSLNLPLPPKLKAKLARKISESSKSHSSSEL